MEEFGFEPFIKVYGVTNQECVAMEEMAELSKELSKGFRKDVPMSMYDDIRLREEIADVVLAVSCLVHINGLEGKEIADLVEAKYNRSLMRLKEYILMVIYEFGDMTTLKELMNEEWFEKVLNLELDQDCVYENVEMLNSVTEEVKKIYEDYKKPN